MRTLVSLLLALSLAFALGLAGTAGASAPAGPQSSMADCPDMAGMAVDPTPDGKAPPPHGKSFDAACALNCSLGCAVSPDPALAHDVEAVDWIAAFGAPMATLDRPSALLEAEDPPPRTALA